MSDFHQVEMFSTPQIVEHSDVFTPDAPNWLRRAMRLYEDHNLPSNEQELRMQYTENRMFIQRLEKDRQNGLFTTADLQEMEEAFAKSCADPNGDPMLTLEVIYLRHFDARQPKRHHGLNQRVAIGAHI